MLRVIVANHEIRPKKLGLLNWKFGVKNDSH